MAEEATQHATWKEVEELVATGDRDHVVAFIQGLQPSDVAYTLSRLDDEVQQSLFELLPPDLSAELIQHLADQQAADVIEELPADRAAAIVDELESDDQADILGELEDDDAAAILDRMAPEEASDVRERLEYAADTAGGIMVTEYLVYSRQTSIGDVIEDLRANRERYADYDVRYIYVADADERFKGVVRLRDLLLAPGSEPLSSLLMSDPDVVTIATPLQELEGLFDHNRYSAVPVVDAAGLLEGVVRRSDVEETHGELSDKALARFGGIVGGEELRTMSTLSRAAGRLAYLVPNIFLLALSVSVIAVFKSTVLDEVIALAIFLPLVAGLSGCSGNQAVAVSIREITLGLAKPTDVFRVLVKELGVGVINGLVLGVIAFGVTATWASLAGWPGSMYLGGVIGLSVPVMVVFSVVLGGTVPLILRGLRLDPAMASGPIITTLIDFFGFFTVLGLASLILDKLTS